MIKVDKIRLEAILALFWLYLLAGGMFTLTSALAYALQGRVAMLVIAVYISLVGVVLFLVLWFWSSFE